MNLFEDTATKVEPEAILKEDYGGFGNFGDFEEAKNDTQKDNGFGDFGEFEEAEKKNDVFGSFEEA